MVIFLEYDTFWKGATLFYHADTLPYWRKRKNLPHHPAAVHEDGRPFRYYQLGEPTVHLNSCIEVEAAYYGAPPGWIGRKVNVQWDAMFVRLLDPRTGELLREHLSGKRGGHRIRDADRPRRTQPQLLQLLAPAHKAGPSIGAVCDSRVFSNWSSGMAARLATMPVRRRRSCALPNITSCAAIWSAARRLLSACGKSIYSSAN